MREEAIGEGKKGEMRTVGYKHCESFIPGYIQRHRTQRRMFPFTFTFTSVVYCMIILPPVIYNPYAYLAPLTSPHGLRSGASGLPYNSFFIPVTPIYY